jgi:hypothetical protein
VGRLRAARARVSARPPVVLDEFVVAEFGSVSHMSCALRAPDPNSTPAGSSSCRGFRRGRPSPPPRRLLRTCVETAAALLLWLPSASAKVDVHTRLGCPVETPRGHPGPLNVRLENGECSAYTVRLLSSFSANTSQTASGVSVWGPVHMFETVVPAGDCQTLTPTIVEFSPLLAYPPVPDSLFGAVTTFVVIAEWTGGARSKTETQQCLIPVPEPSLPVQLVCGVVGLVGLAHLRRRVQR